MLRKRYLLPAIASLILIGWLVQPQQETQVILDRSDQPELVQEMRQFQQIRLSKNGQPLDKLTGKSLQQLQDGSSKIEAAEIFSSSGWNLQADNAAMSAQSDDVQLIGNVHIVSQQDRNTRLSTDQLDYYRASQSAETDKAVTISGNRYRLTSQGMRIDLEAGTMQLLANTRGTYEISGSSAGSDSDQPTSSSSQ